MELRNRLVMATQMWREATPDPLPRMPPGDPAGQLEGFELRLVEMLWEQATPQTARDIAYALGPRHALDLYLPAASAKPPPLVVFFYGGGWTEGTKDWYRFMGMSLTKRGVVVVVPDYRLSPEVRFPAFMEDAALAVAWARANVARFGGDPHWLFLMGPSAGAHMVTLLALDPEYLRAVGLSSHDMCGVIGMAGPYDFSTLSTARFFLHSIHETNATASTAATPMNHHLKSRTVSSLSLVPSQCPTKTKNPPLTTAASPSAMKNLMKL